MWPFNRRSAAWWLGHEAGREYFKKGARDYAGCPMLELENGIDWRAGFERGHDDNMLGIDRRNKGCRAAIAEAAGEAE
jgi:hypothetical protein